ncbi:hypothetical protein LOK49_LG15G00577 [Camellia lanceoleosa]|uniref:Uncharacterized protein n=1 Tax=Camellia lanceoleosa TaxID=1840588 RepID=A0ACC0F7D2_9ERIC|nr:hypothetical protein LOK49_LG15G00577 [Camellia lanceoleosa]
MRLGHPGAPTLCLVANKSGSQGHTLSACPSNVRWTDDDLERDLYIQTSTVTVLAMDGRRRWLDIEKLTVSGRPPPAASMAVGQFFSPKDRELELFPRLLLLSTYSPKEDHPLAFNMSFAIRLGLFPVKLSLETTGCEIKKSVLPVEEAGDLENGSLPLSRSQSDSARTSPIGDPIEDKVIASELRNASNRRSNGTPIDQEMSKEVESKHNPPSVVAKLMGLDTLPRKQSDSAVQRSHSRDYARSHSDLRSATRNDFVNHIRLGCNLKLLRERKTMNYVKLMHKSYNMNDILPDSNVQYPLEVCVLVFGHKPMLVTLVCTFVILLICFCNISQTLLYEIQIKVL